MAFWSEVLTQFYDVMRITQKSRAKSLSSTGTCIGEVIDNNDPLKLGRLRIYIPEHDESILLEAGRVECKNKEKNWSPYVSPFGGMHNSGLFFVPDIGAKVVVGFFNNDLYDRFWLGAINNPNTNNPPLESIGSHLTEYPKNRIIKTPAGHTIEMDDTSGYERIAITTANGNSVSLEDYRDNALKVEARGDVYIHSGGNIVFEAEGDIFMKSNRDIALSSGSSVNIACPNDVNVEKNLNIHGDTILRFGGIMVADGSIDVNGNVLATGNMLCEGLSTNHHQHIVIAEAVDRDVDGGEIIDKRMIRASHVHTYQDKHIVENHTHQRMEKCKDKSKYKTSKSKDASILRDHPEDSDDSDKILGVKVERDAPAINKMVGETYDNMHHIGGATCELNIKEAENNEHGESEFVCTKRISERDCHEHLKDVNDTDSTKIETKADSESDAKDMNSMDGGKGKTGYIETPKPEFEQQNVKTDSPDSMIDGSNRKTDVIIEQVDRDYYEKTIKERAPQELQKNSMHDTPFAVMQHRHSVRGIAI
jgi:phage baseplate assembly protein gpV